MIITNEQVKEFAEELVQEILSPTVRNKYSRGGHVDNETIADVIRVVGCSTAYRVRDIYEAEIKEQGKTILGNALVSAEKIQQLESKIQGRDIIIRDVTNDHVGYRDYIEKLEGKLNKYEKEAKRWKQICKDKIKEKGELLKRINTLQEKLKYAEGRRDQWKSAAEKVGDKCTKLEANIEQYEKLVVWLDKEWAEDNLKDWKKTRTK